ANVVQRKVAERMDYLVAQSRRHRERSAIDERPRSSSLESARMTNRAAYRCKQRITARRRGGDWVLPARCACCCHEVGECQHVAAVILWIRYRIEWRASAVLNTFSSTAGVLSGPAAGSDELRPRFPSNLLVIPISFR